MLGVDASLLAMERKEDTIYTPPDNLNNYTTVFLSGTLAKILPVKKINDFFFKVDNNIPRQIIKSCDEEIIKYCKAGFL